ncbi:MAG: magnesium transporter MgtC [Deltaproteobacteria bacterium HGW-Deltaproteobacteria-4]|nr:MAG: magnesium transporter MgtC [Deltaproteobacteria bacterium HGW-Deltaproteobacteria-4]
MLHELNTFGPSSLTIIIKLLLAALAGALVGMEREKHGRPAGLRTHLLVALASCLMMIISESVYLKYGQIPGTSILRIDPSRIAAQIIAGIGFIGAGVILKDGLSVRGLTTAACLWLAAAIGMGFGLGLYLPTIVSTIIAISALIFLKRLEPYIHKDRYLTFRVETDEWIDIYPQLEEIFVRYQMIVTDVSCSLQPRNGETHYKFVLTQHRKRMGRELALTVAELKGVKKIEYL